MRVRGSEGWCFGPLLASVVALKLPVPLVLAPSVESVESVDDAPTALWLALSATLRGSLNLPLLKSTASTVAVALPLGFGFESRESSDGSAVPVDVGVLSRDAPPTPNRRLHPRAIQRAIFGRVKNLGGIVCERGQM